MNDPGLDEPIGQASSQVKDVYKEKQDIDMDEEEEVQSFLLPTRWWYASTAFPLMAGTFGPMANAFSICALVENWRVSIPPGGTEEHGINIKDPGWLIAVNAVSLVFALVANMALLLNMTARIPFKVAQPITIVGFWVASVLLIGLIGYASNSPSFHEPGVDDQALSQAFYYAIFAAAIYQIISYLMCFTVYGAYMGHYSKEFKLTVAQRTLMLQTISFLAYQLLGALVYSHVESWAYLDAVYWADFTSLTIGIGADFVPTTDVGRGLLFPFAIGGIIILGLVVGSIRSLVLDRVKKKLHVRLTEKTRQRLVAHVQKSSGGKKRKNLEFMGLSKDTARALTLEPGDDAIPEADRRRAEFEAMRKVQERSAHERKWMSLVMSSFAFFFLWTMGAFVFYKSEKNQSWTYFQSLYFSYTTLLTIGYGDFQPMSNSGKPFFVLWSLLAVPTLTILISNMGDTVVKAVKELTIWIGEITFLPSDDNSMMDRLRYGLYKATLGKVDPKRKVQDEEMADDGEDQFEELHPGMAKTLPRRQGNKHAKEERDTGERMAASMEQSEKIEESEAHQKGDRIAEDEHHYRHILISQIRKVYADLAAPTPKQYTYEEWTYFLRLLGEDEEDSTFHRKPRVREPNDSKKSSNGKNPNPAGERMTKDVANGKAGEKDKVKWSWVGSRSPLLCDKEESEWLLEKLFVRLEESLRAQREEMQGQKEAKGKSSSPDSEDTARSLSEGGTLKEHED